MGDERHCEDGVDCSFLHDISGLQPQLNQCHANADLTLTRLLLDLFTFYAELDHTRHSLCLLSGQPEPLGLTIRAHELNMNNPLEPDRNLAGNVRSMDKFKEKCARSASLLRDMLDGRAEQSVSALLDGNMGLQPKKLQVKLATLLSEEEETLLREETGAKFQPASLNTPRIMATLASSPSTSNLVVSESEGAIG